MRTINKTCTEIRKKIIFALKKLPELFYGRKTMHLSNHNLIISSKTNHPEKVVLNGLFLSSDATTATGASSKNNFSKKFQL